MFFQIKMSGYDFRITKARQRAEEIRKLRESRPPMHLRLTRANTGIRNIYEKSQSTGASRDDIEEADVMEQCEQVILPHTIGKSVCWLCGFLIGGLGHPMPSPNLYYSQFLDSAVCEHVLPVRIASVLTGLYYPHGGISPVGDEHLLHSVYEYAHQLCNLAKSALWFISKPNKETPDYCDLVVNTEKIDSFLEYLANYNIHPKGDPYQKIYEGSTLTYIDVARHESGIFTIENNEVKQPFWNNVQYYIFLKYRRDTKDFDIDRMTKEWMADQREVILQKTKGLIEKIQNADGCGTEHQGSLYSATLRELTSLDRFQRSERIIGPSRPIFRRSPSVEEIGRVTRLPFSRQGALSGITEENVRGILGLPQKRFKYTNWLKMRRTRKRQMNAMGRYLARRKSKRRSKKGK
jgi:hypothetical protein